MKYICAEAVYIINTVVTDKKGTEKYKTKGQIASKGNAKQNCQEVLKMTTSSHEKNQF